MTRATAGTVHELNAELWDLRHLDIRQVDSRSGLFYHNHSVICTEYV